MPLRLAIVRVPDHPDALDKEPQILFEVDLKNALKDFVSQKRISRRALRLIDEAYAAAEDQLKHQTTTL